MPALVFESLVFLCSDLCLCTAVGLHKTGRIVFHLSACIWCSLPTAPAVVAEIRTHDRAEIKCGQDEELG